MEPPVQRRRFFHAGVTLAFALWLGQASAQPLPANGDDADSIFFNGNIYTVDGRRSRAEAVAVKDGRFLDVGGDARILSRAGPRTDRHDLQGAMVLPGLTDAHFHLHWGTFAFDCRPGNFGPEALRETLEYCGTNRVEGYPWLIVRGLELWDTDVRISNDILNEMFPDTPVVVSDASIHNLLVNDRALEIAGIGENTPDPQGGRIDRDPDTGRLTGFLVESARSLVDRHVPPYPDDAVRQSYIDQFSELFSYGVTSIQETATHDRMLKLLNELEMQGAPIPYVQSFLVWMYHEDEQVKRQREALIRDRLQYESPHIDTGGIKTFIDGVPVAPVFTHVYVREDGSIDDTHLLFPAEPLARKVSEWDRAGLTGKIANMAVLDRDLLSIPTGDIGNTRVLKTVLDGQIVFERGRAGPGEPHDGPGADSH